MKRMLTRSDNGFTLVEVLVSMMIFALGILAVLNMQLVASATNAKSRNTTEGIVVAQAKIEELMALNYNNAALQDDNGDAVADQAVTVDPGLDKDDAAGANRADFSEPYDPADPAGMKHPNFDVYWNVRPDYPYDGTKTVRVIVRWNEKSLPMRFALDMVKSDGD